jgi:hypothetical protein
MRQRARLVVLLVLPVAAALASSDPVSDDLDRNARLVEKYRRDNPAYYEQLRRDLRAFQSLPVEKRERLRQLDRALREQDSPTQKRLWAVLDRFIAWLDRLPEEDRRRVEEAPTREERMRVIKELREQEFVRRLPRRVRDEVEQLSGEERANKIAALREEEREVRVAWNPKGRHADAGPNPDKPVHISDLSPQAQNYVTEVLMPMLSGSERVRLRDAKGQWPLFARTLLDLAEQHPIGLPPGLKPGVSLPKQLTGDAKLAYTKLTQQGGVPGQPAPRRAQLKTVESKWPEFARELTRLARSHLIEIKVPLGPCKPDEFMPAVKAFITDELTPALTDAEKQALTKAEGVWPDYPDLIVELTRKHNLEVPMMRLPGAEKLRERVRNAAELPDLPDRTLREFFLTELSDKDRADLRQWWDDSDSRDRLRKKYFERYPNALKRLRDLDRRNMKD